MKYQGHVVNDCPKVNKIENTESALQSTSCDERLFTATIERPVSDLHTKTLENLELTENVSSQEVSCSKCSNCKSCVARGKPASVYKETQQIETQQIEEPIMCTKSKGLKFACHNIRHLMPKLDEVKMLIQKNDKPTVHVYGVLETFLSNDVLDCEISIDGYKFERKDRDHRKGGGLVIYIHENIPYVRRYDVENAQIEMVCIEIKYPNKSYMALYVYRPPDNGTLKFSEWLTLMDQCLSCMYNEEKDIVLLGDINIDWNCDNAPKSRWEELCSNYHLNQMVHEPTRVTSTTATIIDHIFVSDMSQVQKVSVPKISMSDHYPVCIILKPNVTSSDLCTEKHKIIRYRDYKHLDQSTFLRDLSNTPWGEIVNSSNDINESLEKWTAAFIKTNNKHAPKKVKRVKYDIQPPWMTQEIITAINK